LARRFSVLAVMLVAIAALFWAGVRNLHARRAALASSQVELTPATAGGADALPPDIAGANLQGKPAPSFSLVDTTGKKVSLSDFKGHPVMINFWASWCGPCKLEMPWIQEFYGKYKPQGFVVLGLDQDDGMARAEVANAADKIGVTYPILMPDETVAKAYGGVDYLPETFYLDKAGKVVTVTAGAPTKDQMEASIRQAIGAGGA
jgi:thiol-disulfide isomerase/thioredoxin